MGVVLYVERSGLGLLQIHLQSATNVKLFAGVLDVFGSYLKCF